MKPYACEVCQKTFNSPDNRNAHRYVHSDKKPFECVTCGSGFMRKSQLYSHMQKRGHLNDTIVVNQPRINANDTLEFETEPVATDVPLDGGEHSQDEEQIACDEENADGGVIGTEQYYQRSEQQTGGASSSSIGNMQFITKIEINDTDWDNFIEED